MKSFPSWSAILAVLIVIAFVGQSALAAALSDNRDTPELRGVYYAFTQASNTIYAGAMVCINSNALAAPAAASAGYVIAGRAESKSDNTGSSYAASTTIKVKRGVFRWGNGDSITDADVGSLCYVSDDQTVVVSTNGLAANVVAGVIVDVDSSGVWVDCHNIGAYGAAAPASLAVSGNATVGGTLGVTGVATLTAKPILNGGADINEEIDIDLDAADEEIDIKQAAVAGTAGVPLFKIDDNRTGATADSTSEATLYIDAEGVYALALADGGFALADGILVLTPTAVTPSGNLNQTVATDAYTLAPAAVSTCYLANASAAGTRVTFVNLAATNVMFLDTGNLSLSGNATLGQYDTITLYAAQTNRWIEAGQVNN